MADRTSYPTLGELVTAAIELAGGDLVSHGARLWKMEGGRGCPLGWGGCSQAVYFDVKTGEYDYGDPGGPGHADCVRTCKNGLERAPDETDIDDLAKRREQREPHTHTGARNG